MKYYLTRLLSLGLILPTLLFGTELMPWSERDLQLYPKIDYLYQYYSTIHSTEESKHQPTNDHFLTLGIYGAYSPWMAELEVTALDTRKNCFTFDEVRITGRYQWMNDIVGDFVSLTTGISLIRANQTALKDISTFHHGRNEMELHIAVGRECSCQEHWTSRWWGVYRFGVGDHGSPWMQGEFFWERNFLSEWGVCLFAKSLHGLGGNSLDLEDTFDGYGSISHHSVDLGSFISYRTDCKGVFRCEYTYRVYARNFPKDTSRLLFRFVYPFGL